MKRKNEKSVLEMHSIEKSFPGVKVLKGIDLEIHTGEVVSILGENGAGKSTLMKILSGAYSSAEYTGSIMIEDRQISYNSPKEAENNGVVMIYQENNPFLDISVSENIFMGCFPVNKYGFIDWKETRRKTKEMLASIDLDIDPDTKMRYLNGSEHQLIAILKAISKNSKVLILDEPTSTLTKSETDRLFRSISQMKKKGVCCFYISHKIDEVFEISDRIIVLRDGTVAGTFTKEDFDYDLVISTMIGREMENIFPDTTHEIGESILSIEDFTVQHPYNREENIVENVSLDLRRGEILGLVGLVGSGRSELVNAVYGKIKKKSGSIRIKGQTIEINDPRDALGNGIALITEDRKKDGLVLIHSIKDNLSLASIDKITKAGVIDKKLEAEKVAEIMRLLNVKAGSSETKTTFLSGGNQQKIVIGKCLLSEPRVFILDEPTRGIDIGSKYEIYQKIIELAREGISIILISSEFSELLGLCDRLLILRGGNIQKEYIKGEANQNKLVLSLSGIEV